MHDTMIPVPASTLTDSVVCVYEAQQIDEPRIDGLVQYAPCRRLATHFEVDYRGVALPTCGASCTLHTSAGILCERDPQNRAAMQARGIGIVGLPTVRVTGGGRVHRANAMRHLEHIRTTTHCARRISRARPTRAAVDCLDCLAREHRGSDVTDALVGGAA